MKRDYDYSLPTDPYETRFVGKHGAFQLRVNAGLVRSVQALRPMRVAPAAANAGSGE